MDSHDDSGQLRHNQRHNLAGTTSLGELVRHPELLFARRKPKKLTKGEIWDRRASMNRELFAKRLDQWRISRDDPRRVDIEKRFAKLTPRLGHEDVLYLLAAVEHL